MTNHEAMTGDELDDARRWWAELPLAVKQSLKSDPSAAVDVTLLGHSAATEADLTGAIWTNEREGADGFYLSDRLATFVADQDEG